MSNPSVSRYDKYIPLFSHAGDRRVRLWLHTIETQNSKHLSGGVPSHCNNVELQIGMRQNNGVQVVPRALDNKVFKTPSSG